MELRAMTVVRHTADLEAMIDFYRDALGMAVTKQWDRSAADRGAILAPAGHVANATVEVLTLGDVAVPGVAPVNIVLTVFVDDARSALRRVRAAGIAIARELEDTSWGHRSFGVDDPDGLRIWIVEELDSPAHP